MDHTALAAPATVARLAEALAARNIEMIPVATKAEALAKIKELIPAGATVMNGSSLTLEQIGYTEFANSDASPWVNLHKGTGPRGGPGQAHPSAPGGFYLRLLSRERLRGNRGPASSL